jgi:DNA-binding response OmpR family regulator
MSKKVLIVEQSLAVRGIAESLLRQNGYEVVAADSAAAAGDILRDSKIDLLLVASDLSDESGKPYYESLGADTATAVIPLLILHDPTGGDIAYPPEAVISKPFTPRDFLEAVSAFGGGQSPGQDASPFGGEDLEDAIIDSALGLDKIEVDDAEVMDDDSSVFRKKEKSNKVESMIGYDAKVSPEDTAKNLLTNKVDAINVPPETPKSEIELPSEPEQKPKEEPEPKPEAKDDKQQFLGEEETAPPGKPPLGLSESSKIEIVTDQYGISAPGEIPDAPGSADSDEHHDYDWFLKELQKEGSEADAPKPAVDQKPKPQPSPPAPPPEAAAPQPAPTPPQAPQEQKPEPGQPETHTEAVDKFISEFKKEMEKITGDATSGIEVTNIAPPEREEAPKPPAPGSDLKWEEGLEKVTPAEIQTISEQLVASLADQIAEKIVASLDKDIIYHLIKDSIDTVVQRYVQEKSRKS